MLFAILIGISISIVILIGPFPRAWAEKDFMELIVDLFLIGIVWSGVYIFTKVDIISYLNRIFN